MDPIEAADALLRGVPEGDVRRLLRSSRRRSYAKGEIVFHEGDPGDALHVILDGHFLVRPSAPTGEEFALAVLGPGETFGELALIRNDVHRAGTVRALEAGATLSIDASSLRELRDVCPIVTERLLTIVADKVGRYTQKLMEVLYLPAGKRVLRRLLELREIYGDRVPLRQEDLAALAGTSRATANEALRQEAERGTIRLARSSIEILDAEALSERASTLGTTPLASAAK